MKRKSRLTFLVLLPLILSGTSLATSCTMNSPSQNQTGNAAEAENQVENIEVSGTPSKEYYKNTDAFDATGLSFKLKLKDGKEVDVNSYDLSFGDIDFTDETKPTVAITYDGEYGKFTLTYSPAIKLDKVVKLEVINKPNKLTYAPGEKFNSQGINLLATWSDGYRTPVTYNEVSYEPRIIADDTTSVKITFGGFTQEMPIKKAKLLSASTEIFADLHNIYKDSSISNTIKVRIKIQDGENIIEREAEKDEIALKLDGKDVSFDNVIKTAGKHTLSAYFNNKVAGKALDIFVRDANAIEAENLYKEGETIPDETIPYGRVIAGNPGTESNQQGGTSIKDIQPKTVIDYHFNRTESENKKGTLNIRLSNPNVQKGGTDLSKVKPISLDDNFEVKFNGKVLKSNLMMPGTFGWLDWYNVSYGDIEANTGDNIVEVNFVGKDKRPVDYDTFKNMACPNLDKVNVSFDTSLYLEAEDLFRNNFTLPESTTTYGMIKEGNPSFEGNDCGGSSLGGAQPTTILEYHFNSAKAKEENLTLRLSNPFVGGDPKKYIKLDDSLDVQFNGQSLKSNLKFPGTRGWKDWYSVNYGKIQVKSGDNIIRLNFLGKEQRPIDHMRAVPNLDAISITSNENQIGKETVVSSNIEWFKANTTATKLDTLNQDDISLNKVYDNGLIEEEDTSAIEATIQKTDGTYVPIAFGQKYFDVAGEGTHKVKFTDKNHSEITKEFEITVKNISEIVIEAENLYKSASEVPSGMQQYGILKQGNPYKENEDTTIGNNQPLTEIEYHFNLDEGMNKNGYINIKLANSNVNGAKESLISLDNNLIVRLNGKLLKSNYGMPGLDGWGNWITVSYGAVTAKTGDNVINLKFIGHDYRPIDMQRACPNLDNLSFSYEAPNSDGATHNISWAKAGATVNKFDYLNPMDISADTTYKSGLIQSLDSKNLEISIQKADGTYAPLALGQRYYDVAGVGTHKVKFVDKANSVTKEFDITVNDTSEMTFEADKDLFYNADNDAVSQGRTQYGLIIEGNPKSERSNGSNGSSLGFVGGAKIDYHFNLTAADNKNPNLEIRLTNSNILKDDASEDDLKNAPELDLDNNFEVKINGTVVKSKIKLPGCKGWFAWMNVDYKNVNLKEGDNVIEVTFVGNDHRQIDGQSANPNLDYLKLTF